jgi:hypothetical protein
MAEQGVGEQLGRVDALLPEKIDPIRITIVYQRQIGRMEAVEEMIVEECHFFTVDNAYGIKVNLYRVMGGGVFLHAQYMNVLRFQMVRLT